MSEFSGKCDLADDFFMSIPNSFFEKHWHSKKRWGKALQGYFEKYKESLGGVIYRPIHIDKITEANQEIVAKYILNFKYEAHEKTVSDRRYKTKEKTVTEYTYTYWDVKYDSLKELNNDNKDGFYLTVPQPIETIYDLIEFFPWVIGISSCTTDDEGIQHRFIRVGRESYTEIEYREHFYWGWDSYESYNHYKKELRDFRTKCIKAGL